MRTLIGIVVLLCLAGILVSLGSGLFQMSRFKDPKRPVQVGLGTDVGASTPVKTTVRFDGG